MTAAMPTHPASPAVTLLCQQFTQLVQAEVERLAKVAFETDKLDPAEGWRFDVFNAVFVKPEIVPAPVVDTPDTSPVAD